GSPPSASPRSLPTRSAAPRRARGRAAAAPAGYPASASATRLTRQGRSLMGLQAEPEQALLQRRVGRQRRHLAAMDDLAVIHHHDAVAELAGGKKILFDQQNGGAAALDLGKAFDQGQHDRRRQALGRLVDQEQFARLDDG